MEQDLHMLLYRAFHAQRKYLRPRSAKLGLGPGQPRILSYLVRNGTCRQKDLAEYLEVDKAAISRTLDSMEKRGFVTRKTDEEHRRADLVSATEAGHQVVEAWHQNCQEMEKIMMDGFTPEEQAAFMDYLSRVYKNLWGQMREEG